MLDIIEFGKVIYIRLSSVGKCILRDIDNIITLNSWLLKTNKNSVTWKIVRYYQYLQKDKFLRTNPTSNWYFISTLTVPSIQPCMVMYDTTSLNQVRIVGTPMSLYQQQNDKD